MIKKLNLTALLIMLMLINQLFAQTDKILLYGSCNCLLYTSDAADE